MYLFYTNVPTQVGMYLPLLVAQYIIFYMYMTGSNPTITSYNVRVGKTYNAKIAQREFKVNIFLCLKHSSLQITPPLYIYMYIPTCTSYNASVVKNYNKISSLVRVYVVKSVMTMKYNAM
jgi:hypothetical protein